MELKWRQSTQSVALGSTLREERSRDLLTLHLTPAMIGTIATKQLHAILFPHHSKYDAPKRKRDPPPVPDVSLRRSKFTITS